MDAYELQRRHEGELTLVLGDRPEVSEAAV